MGEGIAAEAAAYRFLRRVEISGVAGSCMFLDAPMADVVRVSSDVRV